MEKKDVKFIVISIILCLIVATITFFIGRATADNSAGADRITEDQRAVLARIGEYEQREADRISRHAERLAREGERIERTEAAIRALRLSDRRSSSLLEEITKELDILADYFRDSRSSFNDELSDSYSEIADD